MKFLLYLMHKLFGNRGCYSYDYFYDTFISMMTPLPLIIVSTQPQAILVRVTVQGHSGLWRILDCWGRHGCNPRENYIIGYTSEQ